MDAILVGVDYGNGNTKGDTGFVMPSGVKMLATKPPIETKTLSWNGQHYAVGISKMEIQKSKMDNEDMRISTMAAIGEKFKTLGITSGDIRLGVGLPLTMMGKDKRECHDYYMKNRKMNFRYEGVNYLANIISVDVFPQGYAAVVSLLGTFGMTTVVVDVGSWTIDILPITEGQPDVSRCKSLSLGTLTAMSEINENLRQKFGEEADEAIVKDVMIHGTSNINREYLDVIQDGLFGYVEGVMNNLNTLKFNSTLTEFVFIGGGASVIKNFGRDLTENITIIEDVCINAKGFEDILAHKYKAVS
ncbi:MAG: ParM/StbA family protein [Oribacterium sp.]|nr:ParM/StbA family protein [Oribacterium sp.]